MEDSQNLRPSRTSEPDLSKDIGALSGNFEPLLPLLKRSVEHMKKSNEFVKTTNKELISLNRSVKRQVWLMWFGALVGMVLVVGLLLALREQRLTNSRLYSVVEKLESVNATTEETQQAINEQPTLTVKPADSADPSGRPVLIVKPPTPKPSSKKSGFKVTEPPPKPVEILLDLPPKEANLKK